MKEMLKSKFMIGFVVFVVGFSFVSSNHFSVLEEETENVEIMYAETK